MIQAPGSVTVAPNVLVNLVVLALREITGIARLGNAPLARSSYRGDGVALRVDAAGVSADCYLIAQADTNLLDLGMAVQATVATVIHELAGMAVSEINVFIQDVEAHRG